MMKNGALMTLYVVNGLFVLAGSMLGPLYAIYVEGMAGGIFPISLSWSAYLFSTTVFTLVVAKFGDRVKEKEYLLMAGYLTRALGWCAYIFVNNFYSLMAIQILLGIGEALGSPAFDAIFAEHLDRGKHIKDYSNWKVVGNTSLAVGTLAGGFLVQRYGFDLVFAIMAIIGFVCFVGILFKPRRLL